MLYISRLIPVCKYGVVDTDDNQETIVTQDQLKDLVLTLGLDIKGVVVKQSPFGATVEEVVPYQKPEDYSRLHLRTKVLKGVDIRVYNGEITGIFINDDALAPKTVIKLSDYGTHLSDSVMLRRNKPSRDKKVIIVLNAGMVTSESMPSIHMCSIIWDVSALPDDVVAGVYSEFMQANAYYTKIWDNLVIDNPERASVWKCIKCLNSSRQDAQEYKDILSKVPDSAKLSRRIAKLYWNDFKQVADLSIVTIPKSMQGMFRSIVMNWRSNGGKLDYASLRSSFAVVFGLLRHTSSTGEREINRFDNYLSNFDVPEEVKELYKKMCLNIVAFAESEAWWD